MNGCVPTIDKDERKNVEFIPATVILLHMEFSKKWKKCKDHA